MTREKLSVGRLLNTPTTQRMSKIEFDNADYIESCMVFKNFTSLDGGRSREFVAKFNHPDEAKDFIKNYNQIYDDHEAQLKLASDVYSTDKMHMYQELKAKDEEIAKYQMAIDKQSKRAEALKQLSLDKDNEIATAKMRHKLEHDRYLITEAIIKEKDEEIERLKAELRHYKELCK